MPIDSDKPTGMPGAPDYNEEQRHLAEKLPEALEEAKAEVKKIADADEELGGLVTATRDLHQTLRDQRAARMDEGEALDNTADELARLIRGKPVDREISDSSIRERVASVPDLTEAIMEEAMGDAPRGMIVHKGMPASSAFHERPVLPTMMPGEASEDYMDAEAEALDALRHYRPTRVATESDIPTPKPYLNDGNPPTMGVEDFDTLEKRQAADTLPAQETLEREALSQQGKHDTDRTQDADLPPGGEIHATELDLAGQVAMARALDLEDSDAPETPPQPSGSRPRSGRAR